MLGPYDICSIMHYADHGFTKNGEQTNMISSITSSKAWQRNVPLFLIFCSVVLTWNMDPDQAWSRLSTTDIVLYLKSKYLGTKSFEVHQKHRHRECVPYSRLSHTDVRKINKYYKAECSGRGGWNNNTSLLILWFLLIDPRLKVAKLPVATCTCQD